MPDNSAGIQTTGRRRYRAWMGKVVLQVEEVRIVPMPSNGDLAISRSVRWRDARVEDLTVEGEGRSLLLTP